MKSFNTFDNEIRDYILQNFPDKDVPILDVGAGSGKFRKILFDYTHVDGVEIFEPYIKDYKLEGMYNKIYHENIMNLLDEEINSYPLMIMGDVLEHMDVDDAKNLLEDYNYTSIVCIPYEYEQEAVNGNAHEEHKQSDLTHEIFMKRYPGFTLLVGDDRYGIYVRGMGQQDIKEQPKKHEVFFDPKEFADVKICIATPVGGGSCTIEYTRSLAKTMKQFADWNITCGLMMVAGHNVAAARNRFVAGFMGNDNFTHLLMIDSDHGWDPINIIRLLKLDKDLVGIVARKKTAEIQWAANIPEGEILIENGAMRMDGEIGTGFLMFKRCVFEMMFEEYPELKLKHPDKGKVPESDADNYYSLFQWLIGEDGTERSEDLTFCSRWKDIGGKIWCDPAAAISHIGSYDYKGSISTIFKGLAA